MKSQVRTVTRNTIMKSEWIAIRESTKTKDLGEAIKILQEVKRSLNSTDPRSKIIVDRYVNSLEKSDE